MIDVQKKREETLNARPDTYFVQFEEEGKQKKGKEGPWEREISAQCWRATKVGVRKLIIGYSKSSGQKDRPSPIKSDRDQRGPSTLKLGTGGFPFGKLKQRWRKEASKKQGEEGPLHSRIMPSFHAPSLSFN